MIGGNPWELETGTNPNSVIKYWNSSYVLYIRQHVYLKIVKPGQRGTLFHRLVAMLTSAFLHGFYPIYFFIFGIAVFLNDVAIDS
jgi:lysophospholipid acyltransferase